MCEDGRLTDTQLRHRLYIHQVYERIFSTRSTNNGGTSTRLQPGTTQFFVRQRHSFNENIQSASLGSLVSFPRPQLSLVTGSKVSIQCLPSESQRHNDRRSRYFLLRAITGLILYTIITLWLLTPFSSLPYSSCTVD